MNRMEQEKLGVRKFSDETGMMAGYYSHFIHSAVYNLLSKKYQSGTLVADVGAGEGAFSERLIQNGYNVIAVEKFCDFKATGAKLYKLNLNDQWAEEITEKVNAVVAIEIIEHIENPFHFLRQIRNIIRDDGYVFVSTPNPLDFVARCKLFFKGKVEMMSHPDHRSPIFPDTLIKYCAETGFDIIHHSFDIDTLAVKGTTFKGKMLKTAARFFRKILCRDVYNVGNSNIWILKPSQANIYTPPSHP